jgi:hypothetical protein
MELKEFIAKTVSAGEPLTAQAWNDIVTALAAVTQFVRESSALTARVKITNPGFDASTARVIATATGKAPSAAVPPTKGSTEHVLTGLSVGAYSVEVSAPGFETKSVALDVQTDGALLEVALGTAGSKLPNLFGVPLQQALTATSALGIKVGRIIDSQGRDQAPKNVDAAYKLAPVLGQIPAAGTWVGAADEVYLLVAGQETDIVLMPDLSGMNLAAATAALNAAGLVVGKVVTKTK